MSAINYDNRRFVSIQNTPNGEVNGDTIFDYHQDGAIVWAEYRGGGILRGQLMATVNEHGVLTMRYHHVNIQGVLMTGECTTTPEVLLDGRLRLHEVWRWTSGDQSQGVSIVAEIRD